MNKLQYCEQHNNNNLSQPNKKFETCNESSIIQQFDEADRLFLLKDNNNAQHIYTFLLNYDPQGHAQFQLAILFLEQKQLQQSSLYFSLSLPKIQHAALSLGDARALTDLGVAHEHGFGVKEDFLLAMRYFKVAADEKNNARAQNFVGLMYDHGKGVVEDRTMAVKYYHMAAEQGHVRAQCNLGVMYGTGLGVVEDKVKALRFYQLAAEQGYSQAQYNLGGMYFRGDGTDKNVVIASRWYKLAADKGHVSAQCNLGMIYFHGYGMRQNRDIGIKYFIMAAEKGNARSQYKLGKLYAKGKGVKVNYSKAYEYIVLSMNQGFANSKEYYHKISTGELGIDLYIHDRDYLARHWPQSRHNIGDDCYRAILEYYLSIKQTQQQYIDFYGCCDHLLIPPELVTKIAMWIIFLWPSPQQLQLLQQQLDSIEQEQ
eukprot:TRINITY_DN10916_c0_g1_i1.p1 TRINITY_DN10916_c0_g1~~TRINITY_DN10916_c0_g1_i1.p1  ORF type:complete len:428 (+),score=71.54 TRINITY_DN10916_c0_g1_i1:67-1350(+)